MNAPRAPEFPVGCVVARFHMSHAACDYRGGSTLLPGRLHALEADGAFMHEGDGGTVAIVVAGGHLARIDGAARKHVVPLSPCRRRTYGGWIEPRGSPSVQQNRLCHSREAGLHQSLTDEQCA